MNKGAKFYELIDVFMKIQVIWDIPDGLHRLNKDT